MVTRKEKIEALDKAIDRKEKLKKALETREAKAKRAADTRRKILLGAWVQHCIDAGVWTDKQIRSQMAKFLTKDHDRALFRIKPLPKDAETKQDDV